MVNENINKIATSGVNKYLHIKLSLFVKVMLLYGYYYKTFAILNTDIRLYYKKYKSYLLFYQAL